MRVLAASAVFVLGALVLAGCSSAADEQTSSLSPTTSESARDPGGAPSESGGIADGTGAATGGSTGGEGGGGQAGQLTAGAWDDNLNFDFYLSYLAKTEATKLPGLPVVPRADRLRVAIDDGAGHALGGARVIVKAGSATIFDGPTGSDGNVDVYPAWAGLAAGTSLAIEASASGASTSATALAGDSTVHLGLVGATAALPTALDVALMIDTTGSMGDEITYLRTEFAAIAKGVSERFASTTQRWAIVAYKDDGDEYVVKTTPFADPATAQASIASLSAGGGGDYPEAPDQALTATTSLDWRTGNAARIVFWVADAPHHPGKEGAILDAVRTLRSKGVHVYPIAASGTDDLAEFTMRSAAQLTMGRYLFLTDDSGIGGAHKEPTLPCYFVTRLDKAMNRMIAMELSGTYLAPAAEDILRTGGDPKDGHCTLDGGQQVQPF